MRFISDIISTSEASWLRVNHLVSPNVLTPKEKCAKDREDELSKEAIMLQVWHSVVLSENDYIVKNVKQELYYDRREGIIQSDRSQPLKWGSVKRLWAINILPVVNRPLNKLGLQ